MGMKKAIREAIEAAIQDKEKRLARLNRNISEAEKCIKSAELDRDDFSSSRAEVLEHLKVLKSELK